MLHDDHCEILARSRGAGLVRLSLPCPPMLLEACGYRGAQRFVGLAWGGDDLWYDDGVTAGTAAWHAFLAFVRHPIVAPSCARTTSSGQTSATRRTSCSSTPSTQTLHVGTAGEVRTFLRSLIPPLSPPGRAIAAEQFEALARRPIHMPTVDEVRAAMAREAELCAALDAWLAALTTTAG